MATVATVNELGAYAHNPRGNLWYNDESSLGKKMLLKMGWSKGKGLGKKEDGIKENLKVKFKNTNSGLGYKDDSYNNVMKTEYESILKSLRSEYPQQKSVTNRHENGDLKQRSRIVKSRIRYPKLYSAKDVSRYSEKDMKSILICSLPFKDDKEESPNSELDLKEDRKDSESCMKEEKSENHSSKPQKTYTSQLSISDYFNIKMKKKKGNEQKKKYTSEIKQEEESDSFCNEIEEIESDFQNKKTYKGKEKKSECNKSVCKLEEETKDFQHDMMTEDEIKSSSRKKHKKKRKHLEINGNDEDCKNVLMEKEWEEAANPNKKRKKLTEDPRTFCEEKMQEKSNLRVDELSVSDKKRKRHKKESLNSTNTVESSLSQNTEIVPYKKKKKSHRNGNISVSPVELLSVTSLKEEVSTNSQLANNISTEGLTETTGETLTNIDSDRSEKKEKKHKNKFKSIRKLKSCLKSKKSDYAVKNVSFNENVSYKFFDSENESTSSVSDGEDENSKGFEITATNNNPEFERDSSDNKTEVKDCNLEQQDETNGAETVPEQKMKKCDSLSGLPSSDSPYYNSWVESQQQAIKMNLYKGLLKGIKKHDILKTSNLSFIKGYGNWGF